MTDKQISKEELENQNGEELPDREAMSVIQPFTDPDLPFGEVPKESDQDPGLPPPRD